MNIDNRDESGWQAEWWNTPETRSVSYTLRGDIRSIITGIASATVLSGCAIGIVPTSWDDYTYQGRHNYGADDYGRYHQRSRNHWGNHTYGREPAIIIIDWGRHWKLPPPPPPQPPHQPFQQQPRWYGPMPHPPHPHNPIHRWLRKKLDR